MTSQTFFIVKIMWCITHVLRCLKTMWHHSQIGILTTLWLLLVISLHNGWDKRVIPVAVCFAWWLFQQESTPGITISSATQATSYCFSWLKSPRNGTIATADQHKHSSPCSSQNVFFSYSTVEESHYLFEDKYLFLIFFPLFSFLFWEVILRRN